MKTSICRVVAALSVYILLPGSVFSAQFKIDPAINVSGYYNDNLLLNTDSEKKLAVWQGAVTPALKLLYGIGGFDVRASAAAAIHRYVDNSSLNTNDQYYNLNTKYSTEQHDFGLKFDYSLINTLRTETLDTGDFNPYAIQRERIIVNPSWRYRITEKLGMTAGYIYRSQSYTDPPQGIEPTFVATETNRGVLLLDYSLTPQLRLGSEFDYGHVTNDKGNVSNTYGLRFPVTYDYSETFRTFLAVGSRYTETTNSSTSANNSTSKSSSGAGFLVQFNLLKTFDIGTIEFDAGRSVYPSGFGVLRQRDHVLLNLSAALSDTVSAGFMGRYLQSREIGGDEVGSPTNVNTKNRDFYEFGPNLQWRWAADWNIALGYKFHAQEFTDDKELRSGNIVYMNVGYSIPDISLPD